ncbi:protein FAR1-RELATED SEQUENCE 3-like [Phragmites australis]|uniref:protein FAR1-RELATED SEQUENCE 3-like n=1 Tax=Phragmites australis TaxID=29695 RepID=UPI002D769E43|nr:protein FAR1-RELATED SEQUENCE 3-like [Phragmites australis]
MQCRTDESGWGFVDQLRRVYTRRVFEQVQRTVTSATRYRIDDDLVGRKNHYLVSHTRRTNKISWGQHQFKVCADIECQKFTCECRTWEHTGLFCEHLIRAFMQAQVESIPGSYILRRYTRNARMELPFDRHDERLVGPDGTTQKYRQTTLLVVAMAIVRAGSMSRSAYDKAMKDLKILRGQIENLPADIGHSQGETSTITSRQGWEQTYSSQATDGMCTEENHDENIHTTTVNGIMESRAPHIINMVNRAPLQRPKPRDIGWMRERSEH